MTKFLWDLNGNSDDNSNDDSDYDANGGSDDDSNDDCVLFSLFPT